MPNPISKLLKFSDCGLISTLFLVLLSVWGLTESLIHYPAGFWVPALMAAAYILILYRYSDYWLFFFMALLPVIDQSTKTGQLFFSEFDFLIFLTLFSGHSKKLIQNLDTHPDPKQGRVSGLILFVGFLLFASYCISTSLGLWSAFNKVEQPLSGYHSPWYGLHVAKAFIYSLLLLPQLWSDLKTDPDQTIRRFGYGVCVGLAAVSIIAIQERAAFTGLMDFATNFRITASFWEMNVGGAALDGFLTLAIPFSIWLLMTAHTPLKAVTAMALLIAAAYTVLVTFTRTTYVAVSLSVLTLLIAQPKSYLPGNSFRAASWRLKLIWLIGASLLVFLMHGVFQTGGYRGLAAFITVLLTGHFAGSASRLRSAQDSLIALALTVVLVSIATIAKFWVFKGSYLTFAMITVMLLFLIWKRHSGKQGDVWIIGLWGGLLGAGAIVALHWGGVPAFFSYLVALLPIAAVTIWQWCRNKPVWTWTPRSSSSLLIFSLITALSIAIVSNYQMSERFAQSRKNFDERMTHWSIGLSFMHGMQDWLLGKGTGRFPSAYLAEAPQHLIPGTTAFPEIDGQRFLRLTSNHFDMAFGQLLRVMQRVPAEQIEQPVILLRVRAPRNLFLHVEVCGRQLLYPDGCLLKRLDIRPKDNQWQDYRLVLNEGQFYAGHWYAQRNVYFALALGSTNETVDIADIQLIGKNGTDLLKNGDFRAGNDFWFFTSDRWHLPWHIKNLFLNMLFDQGLFGLSAFLLFVVSVMGRTWKHRQTWKEAPWFLASITGFLCAGLFDNLIEAPRVGLFFYLVCWIMLLRPAQPIRMQKTQI